MAQHPLADGPGNIDDDRILDGPQRVQRHPIDKDAAARLLRAHHLRRLRPALSADRGYRSGGRWPARLARLAATGKQAHAHDKKQGYPGNAIFRMPSIHKYSLSRLDF